MNCLLKKYIRYVTLNVLGTIGISIYILADTFFISKAAGANGITVLNLALPIYGLIFAIGAMIGLGSATLYALKKEINSKTANKYFTNGFIWICLFSIPFVVMGTLYPKIIMQIMGADQQIVQVGIEYFRTFLIFTPFFMLNYLFQGFVRNDNDPIRAMIATLSGSVFNIIFDYVFMFPLKMGLVGAALATGISPILGIIIAATHFFTKNNTITFKIIAPDIKLLINACSLGFASFVTEISSAVITAVFNFLLLGLSGNIAVAAYGIIANLALVSVAIYNGITQGMQPLVSENYSKGNKNDTASLYKFGIMTSLVAFIIVTVIIYTYTNELINIFNSEGSIELSNIAYDGLRIYFIGYLFAGINIISTGFFSATGHAKEAFISSVLRGFVLILISSILLSYLFGIIGVWSSFVISEAICTIVIMFFGLQFRRIK